MVGGDADLRSASRHIGERMVEKTKPKTDEAIQIPRRWRIAAVVFWIAVTVAVALLTGCGGDRRTTEAKVINRSYSGWWDGYTVTILFDNGKIKTITIPDEQRWAAFSEGERVVFRYGGSEYEMIDHTK